MSAKTRVIGALLMGVFSVAARAEVDCADGMDNDGDVAIDMEDDGCYAGGTIYYVSAAGSDAYNGLSPAHTGGSDGPRQSLAAANAFIAGARPGQKILLRRGDTWVDNISPNGSIRFEGVQGVSTAPVTLGAYGPGARPVIDVDPGAGSAMVIRGSSQGPTRYIEVSGLRLLGDLTPGATTPEGVFIGEGFFPGGMPHHLTFRDTVIEGMNAGITNYGDHLTLVDSTIRYNQPGQGVFSDGGHVLIQRCAFRRNGVYGVPLGHQIYIGSSDDVLIEDSLFEDSTDGVKLRNGTNLTVRGCEFTGLVLASLIMGGSSDASQSNVTITNNYFHHSSGGLTLKSQDGTDGPGVTNVVISNNVFDTISTTSTTTSVLALATDAMNGVYIQHNVFYNPIGNIQDLVIDNASPQNVRISNNIFHRADNARPQSWVSPKMVEVRSNPTLQGITFSHNLYQASATGIVRAIINNVEYNTVAAFQAAFPGQETGGAEGDPAWLDPAAGDFHLSAASTAAIDRGEATAVSTDRDGDPRPQGGGFDIGADEYDGPLDALAPAAPRGLRSR